MSLAFVDSRPSLKKSDQDVMYVDSNQFPVRVNPHHLRWLHENGRRPEDRKGESILSMSHCFYLGLNPLGNVCVKEEARVGAWHVARECDTPLIVVRYYGTHCVEDVDSNSYEFGPLKDLTAFIDFWPVLGANCREPLASMGPYKVDTLEDIRGFLDVGFEVATNWMYKSRHEAAQLLTIKTYPVKGDNRLYAPIAGVTTKDQRRAVLPKHLRTKRRRDQRKAAKARRGSQ